MMVTMPGSSSTTRIVLAGIVACPALFLLARFGLCHVAVIRGRRRLSRRDRRCGRGGPWAVTLAQIAIAKPDQETQSHPLEERGEIVDQTLHVLPRAFDGIVALAHTV